MGCDIASQVLAGLSPKRDAWSASVAVLTAYQALHVVLLALAIPYLCARSWRRHLTAASRATLNNVALICYYTAAQGVLAAWLPRVLAA
jgi:cytochrome c oxidase subunit I+III